MAPSTLHRRRQTGPIYRSWTRCCRTWARLATAPIWRNIALPISIIHLRFPHRRMCWTIQSNVLRSTVCWMSWAARKMLDQFMLFRTGKRNYFSKWMVHALTCCSESNIYPFFSCRHVSSRKSPGGKHVTITVRETKTERLTPINQNYHSGQIGNQEIERQIIQTQQNSSALAPRASSATKELDDLMASLSDFKVCLKNRTFYRLTPGWSSSNGWLP